MKFLFVLSFLIFCWTVPAYAEEADTDNEIMSYTERRRKAKLSRLNDAQIFEQQMLERRAQNAKRKKTKRISGSSRSSGALASSSSSGKKSSRRTSSKKGLSGSSGVPSVASGMFVK